MSDEPLTINGKHVTKRNASRFVKERYPNARVSRERSSGWRGGTYHNVRVPGVPQLSSTGKTAGIAWLRACTAMLEHDARVAADRVAIETAQQELHDAVTWAARERAALRYAAERFRQLPHHSGRPNEVLLALPVDGEIIKESDRG